MDLHDIWVAQQFHDARLLQTLLHFLVIKLTQVDFFEHNLLLGLFAFYEPSLALASSAKALDSLIDCVVYLFHFGMLAVLISLHSVINSQLIH